MKLYYKTRPRFIVYLHIYSIRYFMSTERATRGEIVNTVLAVIGTAGIVSVALVAPGALKLLALSKTFRKGYNLNAYLDRTTKRLVERGLVTIHRRRGDRYAKLTTKGRAFLNRYQLHEYRPVRRKHWDGFWHVIVFDIPERKKFLRDGLRQELARIGFVMLQNSVWVYPFECQELIALLRASFFLKKEALYMTVQEVENDRWLKRHFLLPVGSDE